MLKYMQIKDLTVDDLFSILQKKNQSEITLADFSGSI